MADNIGIYRITGQLEAGSAFSSSLSPSHGLNNIRPMERRRYSKLIRGDVVDDTQSAVITFPTGETPPSWTQYYAGLRHAFVISALSSSVPEVSRLNCYKSGSLPIIGTLSVRDPLPGTGGTFVHISGTTYGFTPTVPLTADQIALPLWTGIEFAHPLFSDYLGGPWTVTGVVGGQIQFLHGGSPSDFSDSQVRWCLSPQITIGHNDFYGYPASINITFDHAINPSTVDHTTITVYTLTAPGVYTASDPAHVAYSVLGSVVTINPPYTPQPDSNGIPTAYYRVIISVGVHGVFGETLSAPVTWDFAINQN